MSKDTKKDEPAVPIKDEAEEFKKFVLPTSSPAEIEESMLVERTELGDEDFAKAFGEVGSYTELLNRMLTAHTDQTEFIKESLRFIDAKTSGKAWKSEEDGEDPIVLHNKVISVSGDAKGKEVTGKKASYFILAKGKNVKKVPLYNSGFYIVIRSPTLSELSILYNQIHEETETYGKMFGAIFYMFSDLIIRSTIWDFIEELVLDSNLPKFNKGNRLKRYTSFLDYNPILLQIGSLMYKHGYPFFKVCTGVIEKPPVKEGDETIKEECKQVDEDKIDLDQLQLTDYSKIPTELLKIFTKKGEVTTTEIKAYQKAITKHVVSNDELFTRPIDGYNIHLKIPTMSDYFEHGERFNEELLESMQDSRENVFINQFIRHNYSRIFQPWVSFIESVDDDGKVLFKNSEPENIALVLSQIQNGNNLEVFRTNMNLFIQKSIITHIGYLDVPCPKCKAMSSNAIDGFIPFDAQTHFFTMLVMRLIQAPQVLIAQKATSRNLRL